MQNISLETETCKLIGSRFVAMEDLELKGYKPADNDYMVYEDTLFCSPVEIGQSVKSRLSRVLGDWEEVDFDRLDTDRKLECKLIYSFIKGDENV